MRSRANLPHVSVAVTGAALLLASVILVPVAADVFCADSPQSQWKYDHAFSVCTNDTNQLDLRSAGGDEGKDQLQSDGTCPGSSPVCRTVVTK